MTQANRRPQLLVSVRDPAEAEAALAGGADLIDVKEPRHGSLGRADDATLAAVVQRVAGRRPVSAALGELTAQSLPGTPSGLRYVKWGLAGWGQNAGWQRQLQTMYQLEPRDGVRHRPGCDSLVVPVAYADWQSAGAPPLEDVCDFVRRFGSVILFDTFDKSPGRTLLDALSAQDIRRWCHRCQAAGLQVALAGSLGAQQLAALRDAAPDWFAVRGAACAEGRVATGR